MTGPAPGILAIVDRTRAGEILCSAERCAEFAYLISIGDPRERPPAGLRNIAKRIRLTFDDALSQEEGGASPSDIERLLRFAARVDLGRGGLIVHCQAGISRSSAAALIGMASILGPGRELDAAHMVLQANPLARPNQHMLRVANDLMGRGDMLATAWSQARGAPPGMTAK
jgi:predicted protein tyrosine phosphatase